MNRTDRLAKHLREAYAEFDPQPDPLVSWECAAPEKRQAWRAIARAARSFIASEEHSARGKTV